MQHLEPSHEKKSIEIIERSPGEITNHWQLRKPKSQVSREDKEKWQRIRRENINMKFQMDLMVIKRFPS